MKSKNIIKISMIVMLLMTVGCSNKTEETAKTKDLSYQEYIETAKKYRNKEKVNEAKSILKKAIKKDKKRNDAYVQLMEIDISQNQGDEALKVLNKAKKAVSKKDYEQMDLIEETAYYSCYKKIINDLEKEYGEVSYDGEYLTGVYFMSLVDFNNDGISELLVYYTKEGMKPVNVTVYTYDQKVNKCKSIFEYSGNYVDDGTIVYTKDLPTNYLILDDEGSISSYVDDGNRMIKKETSDGGDYSSLDVFSNHFDSLITYSAYDIDGYGAIDTKKEIFETKSVLDDKGTTRLVDVSQNKVDYSLYHSIIDEANSNMYYTNNDNHIFYDLDGDGVKELGLNAQYDCYDQNYTFYTIKNNKVVKLDGMIKAQHASFYTDQYDRLTLAATQSGCYRVTVIKDGTQVYDGSEDAGYTPDDVFNHLNELKTYSLSLLKENIENK